MADLLLKVAGRVQELLFDQHAFMDHVRTGNIEEVRKALEDPRTAVAISEIRDEIGQTPVHCAAGRGDVEMLKLLYKKGTDFNAMMEENGFRRTALHLCCILDMKEALKYLLRSGANPLIEDMYGKAPIYYARDAETVRALQQAAIVETNLQHFQRCLPHMERIVGDGQVGPAITQYLGEIEDAHRVVRTYHQWQASLHGKNNKSELEIPSIRIPGLSTILTTLRSMKEDLWLNVGYFAFLPRGDSKESLSGMIKVMYIDYNGKTAMQIADIFVQVRWRRRMIATWMVGHVCEYALRGPRHISKVFAVVADGNLMAQNFFSKAGFHKESPYNVPWKYRKAGQAVYQVHDSGITIGHIARLIDIRGRQEDEWLAAADAEAHKAAELEEEGKREFEAWEKKWQDAAQPSALAMLERPGPVFKGVPLLPLRNETGRLKMLGAQATQKAAHFICENDRIPAELAQIFRQRIERSRTMSNWELSPAFRRKRQSRILNCPSELRNAWLEELESDAHAALPAGWIRYSDENRQQMYFNMNTHEHSKDRPMTDFDKSLQHEATVELRKSKLRQHRSSFMNVNAELETASPDKDRPFVINVAAQLKEEREKKQNDMLMRKKNDELVDSMVEKIKDIGGKFEDVVEAINKHADADQMDDKEAAYMISRAKKCFADSDWAKPWSMDSDKPIEKMSSDDHSVRGHRQKHENLFRPGAVAKELRVDGDSVLAVSGTNFGNAGELAPVSNAIRIPHLDSSRENRQSPAEWVEICAEREKAVYDADAFLQQIAPPLRKPKSLLPPGNVSAACGRPDTAPQHGGNHVRSGCVSHNLLTGKEGVRPGTAPEPKYSPSSKAKSPPTATRMSHTGQPLTSVNRLFNTSPFNPVNQEGQPETSYSVSQASENRARTFTFESRPSTSMSEAFDSRPSDSIGQVLERRPSTGVGEGIRTRPSTSMSEALHSRPSTSMSEAFHSRPLTSMSQALDSRPSTSVSQGYGSRPSTSMGQDFDSISMSQGFGSRPSTSMSQGGFGSRPSTSGCVTLGSRPSSGMTEALGSRPLSSMSQASTVVPSASLRAKGKHFRYS